MPDRIVGYVPAFATHRAQSPYNLRSAPGGELTHLVYAFGGFKQQNTDWVADYPEPDDPTNNFLALPDLKKHWPHLRLAISIGGYANSRKLDPSGQPIFSVIASTDHARRVVVSSCLDLFFKSSIVKIPPQPTPFDGLDVDWEFPAATDQRNFTLLLQGFSDIDVGSGGTNAVWSRPPCARWVLRGPAQASDDGRDAAGAHVAARGKPASAQLYSTRPPTPTSQNR